MRTAKLSRSLAALAAAASAVIGMPAAAQTATGEIGLRGFVANRCGAGGDTVTGNAFSGTISLGELATTEGTIRNALVSSTSGSPAGTIAFGAGCTGTAATVSISATRFSNPNPVRGDASGVSFANDIDYTAQAAMSLSGGGITTLNYTTAASLPAPSTLAITEPFALVPGNLEVRVFGLMPEGGAQSVLTAGNYSATITVTITPS
jgi:hypothetical protein